MTTNNLREEVIIAGFGGQGIILAGRLLAQTGMRAGKEVTFIPSYGAEMRGGTANCMVILADEPIACPLVANPNSLIAMNKASQHKFAPRLKAGGLLVMNTSLIDEPAQSADTIEILAVPVNDLAVKLGSVRAANMVALGANRRLRVFRMSWRGATIRHFRSIPKRCGAAPNSRPAERDACRS
ncbi:MAG: 2-oxoacid:acceptor oxidoreductase family protein [Planctomycetota bacterium]|jgi:2-oxoglutarate ferredoxin oxidoreductase subunit gamma